MIATAKQVLLDPASNALWLQIATQSKSVSESVKRLVIAIKDNVPAVSTCESAITTTREALKVCYTSTLSRHAYTPACYGADGLCILPNFDLEVKFLARTV